MSDHISQLLSACSSSKLLRLHRTHGLKQDELHLVGSQSNHHRFHLIRFPRMVGVCERRGPPTLGSASSQNALRGLVICPLIFQPLSPLWTTLIANCLSSFLKVIPMSCDTYLLLNPLQRAPYQKSAHIFILPLKTIETLCQGLFTMPNAPLQLDPWG